MRRRRSLVLIAIASGLCPALSFFRPVPQSRGGSELNPNGAVISRIGTDLSKAWLSSSVAAVGGEGEGGEIDYGNSKDRPYKRGGEGELGPSRPLQKGGMGGARARVLKILSGKDYSVDDVLSVLDDDEVADFLKSFRGEGYVKGLFKLASLVRDAERKTVVNDERFHRLLTKIETFSKSHTGMSAISYSKVMTSLANLNYAPQRSFLNNMRDGMIRKIEEGEEFDAYSLSHVISALVKLQYYPGPVFMGHFTELTANQLMEFHPLGLMSLIRGFAKLNYDPGADFLKLFTACTKRRLQDFPPRALSSTIQGLATLKYQPNPEFMAQLVDCMDKELENFSWLDVPNTVTALSKLLYTPPEPFMKRLMVKAKEKLPNFNSQALCNFIFGLFKLQHDPGQDFMDAYFPCCRSKMSKFTPAGYSSMIHSVARLGYFPGPEFMLDFETYVTPRLEDFSRAEIWKLVHGLATLYYRPNEAFLSSFWKAIARHDENLTVKDVSLILWSLSVLDVGPKYAKQLTQLVEKASQVVEIYQLNPQADEFPSRSGGDDPAVVKYRQITQAMVYLESLDDAKLNESLARFSVILNDAWVKRKAALGEALDEEAYRATPPFHLDALALCKDAGMIVNSGTLHGVFNIELMIYPWNESGKPRPEDKPFALVLEGRGHYFSNGLSRLTGDAEFRYQVVTRQPKGKYFSAVSRLSTWDWRTTKTQPQRLEFIKALIRHKGIDPAIYLPPKHASSSAVEVSPSKSGVGQMEILEHKDKVAAIEKSAIHHNHQQQHGAHHQMPAEVVANGGSVNAGGRKRTPRVKRSPLGGSEEASNRRKGSHSGSNSNNRRDSGSSSSRKGGKAVTASSGGGGGGAGAFASAVEGLL